MKRELRVVEMGTGRVVMRRDVTGLDSASVQAVAAKLHEQINPDEFYLEDSADRQVDG